MRLTASGVYTRPAPVPKMPPGLVELMEDLTRDVLKHNPSNVYEFCANHMQQLLLIRDGRAPRASQTLEEKIKKAQEKVRQRAEERRRKYDENMKLLELTPQNSGRNKQIAISEQVDQVLEEEMKQNDDEMADLQASNEMPNVEELIDDTKLKAPVHHDQDLTKTVEVEIFHKPVMEASNIIACALNDDDSGKGDRPELGNVPADGMVAESKDVAFVSDDNQTGNLDSTASDTNCIMENNKSSSIEDNVIENDKESSENIRTRRSVSLEMEEEACALQSTEKLNIEKNAALQNNSESTNEKETETVDDSETKIAEETAPENDNSADCKTNEFDIQEELKIDTSAINQIDAAVVNDNPELSVEEQVNEIGEKIHEITTNNDDDNDKNMDIKETVSSAETMASDAGNNSNNALENNDDAARSIDQENHVTKSDEEKYKTDTFLQIAEVKINSSANALDHQTEDKIKEVEVEPTAIEKSSGLETSESIETGEKDLKMEETGGSNISSQLEETETTELDVLSSEGNDAVFHDKTSEESEATHIENNIVRIPDSHEKNDVYDDTAVTSENDLNITTDIPNLISSPTLEKENKIVVSEETKINREPEESSSIVEKNGDDTDQVSIRSECSSLSKADEKESVQDNFENDAITTVDKILVEEFSEVKDDNDSFPEQTMDGDVEVINMKNMNGAHTITNGDSSEHGGESPGTNSIHNTEEINQDMESQDVERKEVLQDLENKDDISILSEPKHKTDDDTDSMGKTSSMDDSTNEDNNSGLINFGTEKRNFNFAQTNNDTQTSMDLETAAITIQKVFRSFLFKRGSTYDNASMDENNMIDDDSEKVEVQFPASVLNKERRTLGISRMDTVLQTVNEEKSLSLSTDDSSLSSAATIIQAHVRGFLVRNRLNSHKTNSTSLVNSEGPSTSLEADPEQKISNNKTVLNIHIVPEGDYYLSRDESLLTSVDLSLDGSPPSSTNLHPLGYDKSEPRKQLKREDAIQSISPPSNNSGKLSEDVDSVKDMLISDSEQQKIIGSIMNEPHADADIESRDDTPTRSTTIETVIEAHKITRESSSSPELEKEQSEPEHKPSSIKAYSDENDVVTPFEDKGSMDSDDTMRLLHSGEFHDVVLPTKVSRSDTSVVREFKNVLVYFLVWNNS